MAAAAVAVIDLEASVVVKSLAGEVIAEVSPPPNTVYDLKNFINISGRHMCPPALQRLVTGDHRILGDDEELLPASTELEILHLTLVVDESPLFTWDIRGNPHGRLLAGSGGDVSKAGEEFDFVNVITVEPVRPLRSGAHFFEFVMHKIGDEQWCGVTTSRRRAGARGSLRGWFYYCGRREHTRGALHQGREGSQPAAQVRKRFDHVKDGDVIGMLLDVDVGGVAFSVNGVVQGGCAVPKAPLFVTTCLDEQGDHVELRKPPLSAAPPGAREALAAAAQEGQLMQFDSSSSSGSSDPLLDPEEEDEQETDSD